MGLVMGCEGGLVGIDHEQVCELLAFVVSPSGPLATYAPDANNQNRAAVHEDPHATD